MNIFEQWTFDRLEKHGLAVFTPYKDRGIDCLAVRQDFRDTPQRIQIKGSRMYEGSNGWWRVNRAKLKESVQKTDFWIFVWPVPGRAGKSSPVFLIIPPGELCRRLEAYSPESNGFWHIYFAVKGQVTVDRREERDENLWPEPRNPLRNYTSFLGNWDALKGQD